MRLSLIITLIAALASGANAVMPIQINGGAIQDTLNPSDNEFMPPVDQRADSAYRHDVYAFDGWAGQSVEINLNCNFDGYLYLFGPDQSLIESNDDYQNTSAARIATTLSESGTHFIVVTSYNPSDGGAYTISVSGQGGGNDDDRPAIGGVVIEGALDTGDTRDVPAEYQRGGQGYHRDIYPGYGMAGQTALINLTADFDCYLYLIGPNGQVVAENDDYSNSNHSRIDGVTLPEDGTYAIIVTSFDQGDTGNYTLTIGGSATSPNSGPPMPSVTPDALIQIGQSVSDRLDSGDRAALSGTNRSGDENYRDGYQFDAPAGAEISIRANYDGFDGYLYLVGPNGQVIAENDDNTGTGDSQITTRLSQSGRHRVVVTSYANRGAGSYTLSINDDGQGWTPPSGGMAIQFGQVVNDYLTQGDRAPLNFGARSGAEYYRDAYVFDASAGTQVTIDVNYQGFDGYLYLVGPNDQIVAENDDLDDTSSSRIDVRLNQSGRHMIVVTSYNPGQGGAYSLSLNSGGGGGWSAGDMPIQFGAALSGQLVQGDSAPMPQGTRSGPMYFRDAFSFNANSGQMVNAAVDFDVDGYLYLIGPNGQVMAENDDAGSTSRSEITYRVNQAGVYRIIVTTYQAGATGSYMLRLQ